MKILKKLILGLVALLMILIIGGCTSNGKQNGGELKDGFILTYGANREVDKVEYKLGDLELELTPAHDNKKIVKGQSSNVSGIDMEGLTLSVKVTDQGVVIFEEKDVALTLSKDNTAEVTIVDDKDGKLKLDNK